MGINDVNLVRDSAKALPILEKEEVIGLDLETGGLSPWRDPVAVVSLYGPKSNTAAVLHVRGVVPRHLRDFLSSSKRFFVGHNLAGFDLLFLHNQGVDVFAPRYYDTLVGEAVSLTSGRADLSVSLKASLQRRLGRKIDKAQQVSAWMAEELTPEQVAYCQDDIRLLPKLMEKQMADANTEGMKRAIRMEMQVLPVVLRMHINGMPIDLARLDDFMEKQQILREQLRAELHETMGVINFGSPIQVKRALQALGIPCESTQEEALKLLTWTLTTEQNAVIEKLIEFKHANKRIQTYDADWIAKFVVDGIVHARYWQCGTDTGRFSSTEPNFQQIPRDMRRVYGGLDGYTVISGDYSQIEVRLAARLAQCRNLLEALKHDDVHSAIGAKVYKRPIEEVAADKEARKKAKAMTFTLLFGGSADRLSKYGRSQGSNISKDEATNIRDEFFSVFDGLRRMHIRANDMARKRNVVTIELPSGMKRVLTRENLTPTRILNTSVQGSAAAGLKKALIEIKTQGLDKYLAATVHDEIVSIVPNAEAKDYAIALEEAMLKGMREIFDDVPLKVEVQSGEYWS